MYRDINYNGDGGWWCVYMYEERKLTCVCFFELESE